MSGYPHRIDNDWGSHFKGHDTQEWKEHNTEWRFHLPYNPQTAGLLDPRNGILKLQIELLTGKPTLAGWTKAIS